MRKEIKKKQKEITKILRKINKVIEKDPRFKGRFKIFEMKYWGDGLNHTDLTLCFAFVDKETNKISYDIHPYMGKNAIFRYLFYYMNNFIPAMTPSEENVIDYSRKLVKFHDGSVRM